jgi:TIR domain
MDVKVFISWSGEPSKSIARALRHWLPNVAQHVKAWMSDEEIKSGARWNDQVASALDDTDFGIVCVTRANQHQPWLMFEAGALAKRLDVGRVVPLCLDLAPAEVVGPLEAFQGRCLDEEGMRRLVRDLMALREDPPAQAAVDQIFRGLWDILDSQVLEAKRQFADVTKESSAASHPPRTDADMLRELVDRVRRIERFHSREVSGVASVGLGATAIDQARASDQASHTKDQLIERINQRRRSKPPSILLEKDPFRYPGLVPSLSR